MEYKVAVVAVCLCIAACFLTATADDVTRIGNKIRHSYSGVDVAGAIFLMNDVIMTDGVLFAYSAYFRSEAKLRFQTWRPINDSLYFELVGETEVIPSVLYQREDVYIASRLTKHCIRVKTGDRLGVFFEQAPGAVAYVFNASAPNALGHTLNQANHSYELGQVVPFDTLNFPYDFSVAAFIDADLTEYDDTSSWPRCKPGMKVPEGEEEDDATTSDPDSRGPPGPRGPRGPRGPTGPQGRAGPNSGSLTGDDDDDDDDGILSNPMLTLGLLIWLLVMTVLVIILITLMATRRKEKRKGDEEEARRRKLSNKYEEIPATKSHKVNGKPVGVTWSTDSGVESGMKDEVVTNYSVDTISDGPITPRSDRHDDFVS